MNVIRYRTQDGSFTGIRVKTGRRYIQVILMDSSGIRVQSVPIAEGHYMKELDYPIKQAKAHFRDAIKRFNPDGCSSQLMEALQ